MRKRPIRSGVLQPIGSISFGQMIDLNRKRIDRRKLPRSAQILTNEPILGNKTSNKHKRSGGRYEYL